jgi:hypothetical protein
LKHNPTNLALVDAKGKAKDRERDKDFAANLNAFATRQLCRILFLWFIQQKRWLGGSPGIGETDFLLKVFGEFKGEDSFFADALLPICFIGIGRKPSERKNWLGLAPTKLSDELSEKLRDRLKELPPLGGGLFTPGIDAFEEKLFGVDTDSGEVTVRVSLPDAFSRGPGRPALDRAPNPARSIPTRQSARPTACPRRAARTTGTPTCAGTTRCSQSRPGPATCCIRACAAATRTPVAALGASCRRRSSGCATPGRRAS